MVAAPARRARSAKRRPPASSSWRPWGSQPSGSSGPARCGTPFLQRTRGQWYLLITGVATYNGYGGLIKVSRAGRIARTFRPPLRFAQVHTGGFYDDAGVLRCAVLLPALARVEDWIRLLPPPPPRCRAGLFDSDSGVTLLPRHVSMPSVSGGTFRLWTVNDPGDMRDCFVSMPSVSGGTFRRSASSEARCGHVSMPSVSGGTFRRMRF
jgi:hypothetical protein